MDYIKKIVRSGCMEYQVDVQMGYDEVDGELLIKTQVREYEKNSVVTRKPLFEVVRSARHIMGVHKNLIEYIVWLIRDYEKYVLIPFKEVINWDGEIS